MKRLFCMLALVLGASAQAQVYFEPGSTKPVNPGDAFNQAPRQQRVQSAPKVRPKLVRCRDGARRTVRMCRGHGGVARR